MVFPFSVGFIYASVRWLHTLRMPDGMRRIFRFSTNYAFLLYTLAVGDAITIRLKPDEQFGQIAQFFNLSRCFSALLVKTAKDFTVLRPQAHTCPAGRAKGRPTACLLFGIPCYRAQNNRPRSRKTYTRRLSSSLRRSSKPGLPSSANMFFLYASTPGWLNGLTPSR